MKFYDYEQVPLHVADEAFADFRQGWQKKSVLDLLSDLIWHCDRWCEAHKAYSTQDQRVDVIKKLQAYLHDKYSDELSQLMRQKMSEYQQQQVIKARLYERRN